MMRAGLMALVLVLAILDGIAASAHADTPAASPREDFSRPVEYFYTAFGTHYVPQVLETVAQRYTFTGREAAGQAAAAAGAPMYYRYRMYSPALGRFGRRDPVLGGDRQFNAYGFPGNEAVNHRDPKGAEIRLPKPYAAAFERTLDSVGIQIVNKTKVEIDAFTFMRVFGFHIVRPLVYYTKAKEAAPGPSLTQGDKNLRCKLLALINAREVYELSDTAAIDRLSDVEHTKAQLEVFEKGASRYWQKEDRTVLFGQALTVYEGLNTQREEYVKLLETQRQALEKEADLKLYAAMMTEVVLWAGATAQIGGPAPEEPPAQRTERVQRWMSRAELEATKETGLLRGGRSGTHYVTDAANTDPLRARQRLSLPQTQEVRVTLEVQEGVFSPPTPVKPRFGMPGGGSERTATGDVLVKIISVD